MNVTATSTASRRAMICAALVACALSLAGCSRSPENEIVVSGTTMGTTYQVKIISDHGDPAQIKQRIDARLKALNDVFSTYIPTSEISSLNRNQVEAPIEVSADMLALLKVSQEVFALSSGAFDITVGPLVNLWGFGPDGPRQGVPSSKMIEEKLAHVGFDRVSIESGTITRPPGLVLDMSAIAKGFAVDEVASLLVGKGYDRFMVEIGGEVRAAGTNANGQAWRIGVETPDRTMRRLQRVLPLADTGMATSGDYRNFFEHEGVIYSHTLDPETGWPVRHHLASVTVFHPSTAYADALATAFSVMGPEATRKLAEAHGLAVLAIIRDQDRYEEWSSPALEEYLETHLIKYHKLMK